MIQTDLEGKSALVTGGNRGIGRAIAIYLAKAGARVAICGRDEETLENTTKALNNYAGGAFYRQVDVRNEEQQEELFAKIKSEFGSLDISVPNAGRAALACASETTLEEWNKDIETNLTGMFITSKLSLKMMREQDSGYILPIVSKAGKKAFKLRASYCASKWGALGYSKSLAEEAEEYNVKVTAVCPASVATDFQEGNPRGTDWMMEPEDVADCVLYLLGLPPGVKIEEILLENFNYSID
ncbi:MAG: SDR family oxidoreductase [bacterium]